MFTPWKITLALLSFLQASKCAIESELISASKSGYRPPHPESDMLFEERVRYHGYPVELHTVYTEDDYILSLYHIPHGIKNPETIQNKNKSIVVFVHGMGGAPQNFIVLGKKSVVYYLAEHNIDVWMFCARGNEGSLKKRHKKLDPDVDNEYWLYGPHEIGTLDLSATIDYILNRTIQQKVFLVGHSAGGNYIWALLSEKPEYNDKVKLGVSWASAPVVGRSDYSFLILLASLNPVWKGIVKYVGGMGELFPQVQILRPVVRQMVSYPKWRRILIMCTWVLGSSKSLLQDDDLVDLMAIGYPPRVSFQQVFHFVDNFNAKEFLKYDYGRIKNMQIYGQPKPPKYNLSAVRAPAIFFYGAQDTIITKDDLLYSTTYMPNVVSLFEVPFKWFTHGDFLFARNATALVYEPLLKMFKDCDEGRLPPPLVILKKDLKNDLF